MLKVSCVLLLFCSSIVYAQQITPTLPENKDYIKRLIEAYRLPGTANAQSAEKKDNLAARVIDAYRPPKPAIKSTTCAIPLLQPKINPDSFTIKRITPPLTDPAGVRTPAAPACK